ncbi:sigma-70 family RNA polymerase sigma factor [Floridanema evergladense]|uniref:Sigma-70 family RNA polymerase sigma factor n=1 Tax=Floridaenema evergladense BLCC-F167 TaxID=3153639 RepID=A0ABV4WUD4_9CYAN
MQLKNSDRHQSFKAEIQALLKSDNPDAYSILTYIQRCLNQFNLSQRYHPNDIFHDAYLRAIDGLQAGKKIENCLAWIRGTALNIIREYHRDAQKSHLVEPNSAWLETALQSAQGNFITEIEIQEDLENVLRALEAMNPEDFKIIRLKYVEGMSWKQISKLLFEQGEELQTEETLRQRASRAKKKLRGNFHFFKECT